MCTRAKEEIYSHEGMVAVALTLLRFNSLGWSVTPTFFWTDDFSLLVLDRLQKNEQKINVGSLKFFFFFDTRNIESRQFAAVRVCKICRLKITFT